MKNLKLLFMSMMIFSVFIFYSCHTETPVNVDSETPKIESMYLYHVDSLGVPDTLYQALADSNGNLNDPEFSNFALTQLIDEGNYTIEFTISDNYNLYVVEFIAKDAVYGNIKALGELSLQSDGTYSFTFKKSDFPIVQEGTEQKYYLYLSIVDESENIKKTSELGFYVNKVNIFEILNEQFGALLECYDRPDTYVDFSDKIGELAFIQFLTKG